MASLISDSDKDSMQSALLDVFDTFKRPLIVFQEPEKIIASTNPNFSRFGPRNQNVYEPEVEPILTTIYAVILYEKQQEFPFSVPLQGGTSDESQIKVKYPEGQVRVKVDQSGFNIFKTAKLVELDGQNFQLDSTPRPHGLFTPSIYTFFLKRV